MYVLICLLLTILTIIEIGKSTPYKKKLFSVLIFFMTIMLAIRYGQGSDYYEYYLQYSQIDSCASLFINKLYHGELGWYILLVIANRLRLNFETFIVILSIVMMNSIGRFIKNYSPYKIFSLLIFYPTFYLTYCFSAIRQGLVMSIFLGFGLKLLIEEKYIKYCTLSVVLIFFHKSAFLIILLPILLKLKKNKIEKYCVFAVALSIVLGYSGFLNKVASIIGITRYIQISISFMAIILRTILSYIIFTLHRESKYHLEYNNCNTNKLENTLYFIYFIGYIIYLTLAFAGILAQRLTMPLKAIEIVLLPLLLLDLIKRSKMENLKIKYLKINKFRNITFVMLVIIMLNVETIKNINSYIKQGNYYSWVNPLNYPYSTIFDKNYVRSYLSHFDGEVK